MKPFVKHMLAVGVTSALSFSLANNVEAATYKVVDKTIGAELKYTYAQEQNSNGVLAMSGSNLYNFPVQFEYLDVDDFEAIKRQAELEHERINGLNDLEDFDALSAGNPTANDLEWVKLFLQKQMRDTVNFEHQQVGDLVAMINLGGDATTEIFDLFDQPFDSGNASGKLTRSTVDIISGVTNSGIVYGSATAPYLPMAEFTTSNSEVKTFWLREFGQRGFFSYDNGAQVFSVVPQETRYGGGVSAVLDVNDNGQAVGYMSYDLNDVSKERVENESGGCADSGVVDDYPFEICVQRLQSSMYELIAYKATFTADGEVTSEELGLLIEPHPDDERSYSSLALAINNDGVAVGYADGWDETDVITPDKEQRQSAAYAVMFKDGKVFDFNQDHFRLNANSFEYSKAHDISDNGLAVGYTYNADFIKKFFYVDTNLPEADMMLVTPEDFFNSSASTAYAVNNNGMIVGDGEIETHNASNDNPRRTSAFLYDTEKSTFLDVNDLLTCNSPYTVVEARSINDSNVITGTAIFKADRYDAKGELMLDSDGSPLREDVARAVILEPIPGGEIEDCFEVEDKVERKGASSGFIALLSLFTFFSMRLFRRIN